MGSLDQHNDPESAHFDWKRSVDLVCDDSVKVLSVIIFYARLEGDSLTKMQTLFRNSLVSGFSNIPLCDMNGCGPPELKWIHREHGYC